MHSSEGGVTPIQLVIGFITTLLIGVLLTGMAWIILVGTPLGDQVMALVAFGPHTAWHLTRATGTVAYLLLTGSVAWGLILTTRIIKEVTPPPLVMAMHKFISWLAIGLAGFHALILLYDTYYTYTLAHLMIPFIGPYRPGWVGLGVIGMYLSLLTSVSYAWRKWLGHKSWRALHYLTFPAYALVTVHGLMAGTDSADAGMRVMFLGSVLLVLFLTNYRLLASREQGKRLRPAQVIAPDSMAAD